MDLGSLFGDTAAGYSQIHTLLNNYFQKKDLVEKGCMGGQ
jgi:hypothetical protein